MAAETPSTSRLTRPERRRHFFSKRRPRPSPLPPSPRAHSPSQKKNASARLQLTIYDDCHFSDYVAVVAQFTHERTAAGAAGGELAALAWVAPARRSSERPPARPDSAFEDRGGGGGGDGGRCCCCSPR